MQKYELKYRSRKLTEKLQRIIVWHLPHWLIMWAVVRATNHATMGKWGNTIVPEITAVEVLNRWDKDNGEAK